MIDEELELVHETEGTLVEPGYPNEEPPIDRRDVALDAAARSATIGVEHRLLCHVFTRWLRVCSLKPARLLAHRALWEADMLARELGRTEGVSEQSKQLAEAAELHVLSLREQIALSSQGDGEAENLCDRLRTRLRGASAEIERLQAELAQAKEEASVQIAAAREEAAYAKGGSFVASGPFQQTPHERALELRAANVLASDENAAGVTVVARSSPPWSLSLNRSRRRCGRSARGRRGCRPRREVAMSWTRRLGSRPPTYSSGCISRMSATPARQSRPRWRSRRRRRRRTMTTTDLWAEAERARQSRARPRLHERRRSSSPSRSRTGVSRGWSAGLASEQPCNSAEEIPLMTCRFRGVQESLGAKFMLRRVGLNAHEAT